MNFNFSNVKQAYK